MDKFPEAFNRYEERVDIDDLQSASELISSFSIFQGYNATSKQIDGLRIESIKRRLGFDWSLPKWVKKKDYRIYYQSRKRYVQVKRIAEKRRVYVKATFNVRGKPQTRYRDVKTGRFIKKPK
jgi:hypothetical protein